MGICGSTTTLQTTTMKVFVCFSALLVAASARPQLVAHAPAVAVSHAPVAISHAPVVAHAVAPLVRAHPVAHAVGGYVNDLAEPSPYNYQYAVSDDYSGSNFAQSESNDGTGAVTGQCSVNLPGGRVQTVTYNANDITGNIAEVTYSGTASYPDVVGAVAHPVAHGVAGHGLVGHGLVGHGVVAHPVATLAHPAAHAVATPLVAHAAPAVAAPVSPLSNGVQTAVIG